MFLLTFPAGLVFYPEKNHQLNVFFIHLVALGIALLGANYIPPIMEIPLPFTFGLMTFLLSMVLLFFIIQTYTKENVLFEEKTASLVGSLKAKNQEIAQQKTDLQKEITEKNKVQKQLKESNEHLKRFVYVASHDLKEPLRTIGSFSHLLTTKTENQLDATSLEYLTFINKGVKRMARLLDDLLAYSSIQHQTNVSQKSINLKSVIYNQKANLNNLIQRNKGQIEIIGTLPSIYGHPTQINQLFQNLISNAIKFKGENPPLVQIFCEEKNDHYIFAIKDNGIGIPQKFQSKIFEAFHRLPTKEYEGTGIGLAICQKVVKNHRGKIWLESEEGKGTTFYFSIVKIRRDILPVREQALITAN